MAGAGSQIMAGDGAKDGRAAVEQAGPPAQKRAAQLRGRNLLLGGALVLLVLLLYAISFVKTPSGPVGEVVEQAETGQSPGGAQPLSGLRKD